MEVVLVVLLALLVAVVALGAWGVWTLVRREPPKLSSGTDLVPVSQRLSTTGEPAPGSDLVAVPTLPVVASERPDHGHVVLTVSSAVLATLALNPRRVERTHEIGANRATTAAMTELVRAVPGLADVIGDAGVRVTFSKQTLRGLMDGSIRWMSGGQAVAIDAATGRIVELGKVGGHGVGRLAGSWPVLLSGAVAAAAAAVQQQQLAAALDELDAGIDRLYQRHIDNDSGALHAAAELAIAVINASQNGPIPEQISRELAVARRQVDGIYFARREQIRRFIGEVERAQNEHEARTGEPKAWPKRVEDAFGDAAQFHADALAFVRAAAFKAHLAAGTAAVIATEGRADVAFELMSGTEDRLRDDVFDLRRRLEALAAQTPSGRWNRAERNRAYEVSTALVAELEQRITPLLPLERSDTITVEIDRVFGELPAESMPPDGLENLRSVRQTQRSV